MMGVAAKVGGICKVLMRPLLDGDFHAIEIGLIELVHVLWMAAVIFDGNIIQELEREVVSNEVEYPIRFYMVRWFTSTL
jgi:hypothetical protein